VSAPVPPGPDAPEPRWDRRRTAGALVGGAIVIGIVLLLVVGLVNSDEIGSSIQDALAKGERPDAPVLSLPVLAAADGIGPRGATVATDDLRGRVLVVNFWASWCEPCELEAPILERVARRYRRGGDVLVVGVDVQDLREKALGFVTRNGLSYPSLRDGGDSAQRSYQVAAMPETFVVDPQGRIALKIPGQVTRPEQLTNAIDQLRAQRS
jgi:cytochrome c biogenesis protein CcmG, thiol:disulfide interchange protein DsbE